MVACQKALNVPVHTSNSKGGGATIRVQRTDIFGAAAATYTSHIPAEGYPVCSRLLDASPSQAKLKSTDGPQKHHFCSDESSQAL